MHHWNYHHDFISDSSATTSLDVLAIIIAILTLLFVVDEYFNRKRRVYKEKIDEFYSTAYEYVKFQEEFFKEEIKDDAGNQICHTTTGYFIKLNNCGSELLSRQDALLDLIFKKSSYVSARVLQLAFAHERDMHMGKLSFKSTALIDQKLRLCEFIKKDYLEYKKKSKSPFIFC